MRQERESAPDPGLPPGIHLGRFEAQDHDRYRVRALGGQVVSVGLGEGFEASFAGECLKDRRTVLVSIAPDGGGIAVGALQTTSATAAEELRIAGRRIQVDAEQELEFRVGRSTLRLDREGGVMLVGQKMTMDVSAVVRILSALVELP